jgi:succinate dehydrogenase / fumarate reductase cytochrome b subunit
MSERRRPLSPHVFHYRWAYTMTLSILHRVSGVALSIALLVFVLWLVSAGLGADSYAAIVPALHSWPIRALIAIALLALVYHFCNGWRHLAWDIGVGFERHQARGSAVVVVIATILLTAACLFFLFRHAGVSP